MNKKIEILAPAGSYESLEAAVMAGADAVYIGGARFGARAFADNLQEEKMLQAIDFAHLHGCKIYLTVNTLLKDSELKDELYNYLLPYYRQGLDAVIVQDIGVLRFIREQFPDLPIHASTQMTVTGVLGAKYLEQLGVERVVTAREMQLHEIRDIAKETDLEIESFVHGALCYCYSGQCLYSSLIGGRSGNRGQCAQPCRLPYRFDGQDKNQYLLSPKDICTLEYIPELVEAGIHSFKIEGRMKKPEYVALVTAMYRKYVDLYLEHGKNRYQVEPKDREKLMDLYNRGGFHGGYYHTKNGREMLSISRPNHAGVPALSVVGGNKKTFTAKALTDIHKGDVIELPNGEDNYTFPNDAAKGQQVQVTAYRNQTLSKGQILYRTRNEALIKEIQEKILKFRRQQPIDGVLKVVAGEKASLQLTHDDTTVSVVGDEVQTALNQPMDEERIRKQMCKTGNTPFVFRNIQIQLEGKVFLPMQSINELRRQGLETLENAVLSVYRRREKERIQNKEEGLAERKAPSITVCVEELQQWKAVVTEKMVARIYLDCNILPHIWNHPELHNMIREGHEQGKEIFLAMPHIFRKETVQKYEKSYDLLFRAEWDGVLIRNYESYQFLREHGYSKHIVTDYNLYQFNRWAKEHWKSEGVERTTAPLELNVHELQDVGLEESELVVYGYFPMMISAQCIRNTVSGCTHERGRISIQDRYHKKLISKNQCDYCYNIIYNTAPTILTDQQKEIDILSPKALRLQFTLESYEQTKEMLACYSAVFLEGKDAVEPSVEFTRGHFKRGIK